ncbi:hypothetical protein BDZ89DRAFT_943053 [Hymenopellis radicata]|nr:hypothetical protein BDZ89DRAFT_943053 [Hymenopellis radicata]
MSSPPRPPSASTTTSLNPNASLRSHYRPPPTISTVVTIPPWAKDEPPSPTEQPSSLADFHSESRPSVIGSLQSSNSPPSRWWPFTLPRPRDYLTADFDDYAKTEKKPQHSFKDRSMSWLPSSAAGTWKEKPAESSEQARRRDWGLQISLPTPSVAPFTLAQNPTPGWESPWTARVAAQGPTRQDGFDFGDFEHVSSSSSSKETPWRSRKKRLRTFILSNTYVPLLFRFINITFTAAALGVAIQVRQQEKENGIMGAVGSSPTLIIIFSPLTLLHVLYAIYLEYFGRPLGLWRTSAKLAHTLFDVLFICMWSSALSLCFDNYFTSLVPCASESTTSWYNELPRPASNLPTVEGSIGDTICDSQVALISLVCVGLLMYCTNLVISLFRIFEKVKYHPTSAGLRVP